MVVMHTHQSRLVGIQIDEVIHFMTDNVSSAQIELLSQALECTVSRLRSDIM